MFKKLMNLKDEVRWFCQRGRRGYSDRDTWSIDHYLCSWMPEALTDLKKRKIGYPGHLKNRAEWFKILDKMIEGFKAGRRLGTGTYYASSKRLYGVWGKEFGKLQDGLNLFAKHFSSLWD